MQIEQEVQILQEQLFKIFPTASFLRVFPKGGWLVGGAVRNTILGRPIKDCDIKVNLTFEEIVARMQIASDAGMYPETDLAIVDKILRYEYPKYGKGLEINVDKDGHTIFIDPETGYAQALFRN